MAWLRPSHRGVSSWSRPTDCPAELVRLNSLYHTVYELCIYSPPWFARFSLPLLFIYWRGIVLFNRLIVKIALKYFRALWALIDYHRCFRGKTSTVHRSTPQKTSVFSARWSPLADHSSIAARVENLSSSLLQFINLWNNQEFKRIKRNLI